MGCTLPGANAQSSSVIAAFWPGTGSGSLLASIDYTTKRIGVVEYFILHSIHFSKDDASSETEKIDHVFCFTHWKKKTTRKSNWFGISAVVCDDCFESPDVCCFLPIQRIYNKCAYTKLNVQFDSYEDTVFVARAIPIQY